MNYFATGKFLENFGDKYYKEIVTKSEIADAVELLGCWFVDKGRDLAKGIQLWSWALLIRDTRKSRNFLAGNKFSILAIPQRDLDPAFEYMDELRTMTEMQEVIADRHRVKMNSLMGMYTHMYIVIARVSAKNRRSVEP